MPRRNYKELTLAEALTKITNAGVKVTERDPSDACWETGESLQHRVARVLGIVDNAKRKNTNMLCFIMYDIESNKVRAQIVKYLLRKGCVRVQKSIFLADLPPDTYHAIRDELSEVQACYENDDSILIVPVSTDHLKAMKIIGKSIDVDVIVKNKNTLFF